MRFLVGPKIMVGQIGYLRDEIGRARDRFYEIAKIRFSRFFAEIAFLRFLKIGSRSWILFFQDLTKLVTWGGRLGVNLHDRPQKGHFLKIGHFFGDFSALEVFKKLLAVVI